MPQESFEKYRTHVRPGSALFVDADLVTSVSTEAGARVYRVPATRITVEEFNKTLVANMVMLGAVAAATRVVGLASLKKSVGELAPKGSVGVNMRAIDRGFEWANTAFRNE